jgi:hypothetical protein
MSSILISEGYKKQQEHLHENTVYGTASIEKAPTVAKIINNLGVTHVLDYGCAKNCNLMKTINEGRLVTHQFRYQPYDPAIERFADPPVPAEMVCCIDVLEHIEPELLDNVLNDLERLTEAVGFFSVHCGPAAKVLQDGRNAHLIQMPPEWWLPKILERWELQNFARTEQGFDVIVYARGMTDGSN